MTKPFSLSDKKRPFLIAEAGNNHEGNFEVAKRLVHLAKESGADAIKFQTFKTEHYVSRTDKARFDRLKSFELSYEQFARLAELAKSLGLLFISTPFDLESADFLSGIVDAFKIASGDNNFFPLLERVSSFDRPLIISTGLSDLNDVVTAVEFVRAQKARFGLPLDLAVLHCVSAYPTPENEVNLLSIPVLKERLGCTIGFSDHVAGIDASLAAIALGAEVVEKHFTLDKAYSSFRDHQLSSDPAEFTLLSSKTNAVWKMRGSYGKSVQACELSAVPLARRSIAVRRALAKGDTIAQADLTWIRPATGIRPGQEKAVIGKKVSCDVAAGDILTPELLL